MAGFSNTASWKTQPFQNPKADFTSGLRNHLCINNPGQSTLIQMGHLPLKNSKKHETGSKVEYTGYLGEGDVDVQICSVLTSSGCKSGTDRLSEETGFNIEMHLIIGYAWAMQGKRLFIWDQRPFKFAMKLLY